MLGDLFSKLDANDSTDTLTLVFHFLYPRQSNDKVVTGFSAHVTAESGGDLYTWWPEVRTRVSVHKLSQKVQDEAQRQLAASKMLQSDSRMSSQFQLESKSIASVGFFIPVFSFDWT